ncbi:MAG: ABC transporter substrate-binding protein [Christensenellales bacterium]
MKHLKRLLTLALVAALLIPASLALAEAKVPLIGVVQLVQHVALDSAYQGFVDALKANGYEDGKNIRIDYQNAQASSDILASIADRFIAEKVDLILAIATPAAQTMAGKTETIPILGTAITDYVDSKLAKSNEEPGFNVSGTTDMNPIQDQIALLKQLVPEAKTVGLLYTGSEDNSVLQARIATQAIEALGMSVREVKINNSNDVQQAAISLADQVDVFYLPTDNVVASAMAIVAEVTLGKKIPVICGEAGMVDAGGTATLGISYYNLGYQTGIMAIDVLGGADVSKMPIQAQSEFEYRFNLENAKTIGLTIPQDLLDQVTK